MGGGRVSLDLQNKFPEADIFGTNIKGYQFTQAESETDLIGKSALRQQFK